MEWSVEQLAAHVAQFEGARWRPTLTDDDVRSVALQSAWHAIIHHKPERGASIETFARLIGRQRLGMAARRANDLRRRGVTQFPDDEKGRPWEPAGRAERDTMVPEIEREAFWRRVRGALTDDEFELVRWRVNEGLTFNEIASRRKRSPTRIRQLWKRAARKLASELAGWGLA